MPSTEEALLELLFPRKGIPPPFMAMAGAFLIETVFKTMVLKQSTTHNQNRTQHNGNHKLHPSCPAYKNTIGCTKKFISNKMNGCRWPFASHSQISGDLVPCW